MNALQQYNYVANNPNIDIQEGTQWIDTESTPTKIVGEQIQFNYQQEGLFMNGEYKYYADELSFFICYQHDGCMIDLEHIFENGEESLSYDEDSFEVHKISNESMITGVTVIDKKTSKVLFTLKTNDEFRFLTLAN